MSNNLLQTVPIFNGDNLRGWTTMEAVLQSKDCFWVIDSEHPSSSNVKERQEWDCANQRCIGNIKLCVSQSIQEMIAAGNEVADETKPTTTVQDQATQANGTTATTSISSASRSVCARGAKVITKTHVPYSAKQIWSLLNNKFSANVTGTHYADFHAMMKVVIPGNEHPTKALQAFHAAVKRLRLNSIEFPEQLEALILLWKLPSAYNTTQTMINFAAHDTDAMHFDTISNVIVRAWEGQLSRRG